MILNVEISKGGPYERGLTRDVKPDERLPEVGELIVVDGKSYEVRYKYFDLELGEILIRARNKQVIWR